MRHFVKQNINNQQRESILGGGSTFYEVWCIQPQEYGVCYYWAKKTGTSQAVKSRFAVLIDTENEGETGCNRTTRKGGAKVMKDGHGIK